MSRRIEIGALVALALFLPLVEAPKTLAWLAYVVTWLVNRYRERQYGGRWEASDTLIAAWILSGFLAAAFAGVQGKEWHGALDLLRYGSVLLILKRSPYSHSEAKLVLGSLIVSAAIGLAVGYWRLAQSSTTLELNSVGNVNHTAIYLAIIFGLTASWALTGSWPMAAIAGFFVFSLFVTSSRAAVFVALALMLMLAVIRQTAWAKRVTFVLIVVAAASALLKPDVWHKQLKMMASQNVLAHRGGVWRIAIDAWREHPIFGVGMTNMAIVTHEQAKQARQDLGAAYDPTVYFDVGHAHSLYLNTLAERGIVGATTLVAVLLMLGIWLVRYRHRRASDSDGPGFLLWGAAVSSYAVTVIIGFANTTLHHEHALLSTLLIGLWIPHRGSNARLQAGTPPAAVI